MMVLKEKEAVLRSKRRAALWKVDVNDVGDEYLKRICDWLELRSRGSGLLVADGRIGKQRSLTRQDCSSTIYALGSEWTTQDTCMTVLL
jgi:hypothetical protein